MSLDTCDSWHLDLVGGAVIIDPDGNETTCGMRLVWTMTTEHTLRFLIYLSGEECPIVRVISPGARNTIASSAIAAFAALAGQGLDVGAS